MLKVLVLFLSAFYLVDCNSNEYDNDHQHPKFSEENAKQAAKIDPAELESEFWNEKAQNILKERLSIKNNLNNAKNIIYFLGDGMSLHTVAAARMYAKGNENEKLSFEKFPHFGLSKTYCFNRQVADSACTATAYLSGVKANYGTIGVSPEVPRYDCSVLDQSKKTIPLSKWAQNDCKATGLVTTTRITHATPAGTYANIADRNWESDTDVAAAKCDPKKISDIAHQLVHGETGKHFKVILGGGRKNMISSKDMDEEGYPGKRSDDRNLIKEWLEDRSKNGTAKYVWNKKQLNEVNLNETDYLLGLFENDHCMYNLDINKTPWNKEHEPTLSEMVETAIKILRNDKNGYFLFVEGGRIDMGHHDSLARHALEETTELHRAVEMARLMTSENDTLIVVTADHAHTMSYNGYPDRGSDILGVTGANGDDELPYSTLSYANGEGYLLTYKKENLSARNDISNYNFKDPDLKYPSTVYLDSETHGGDDVGVYASGPFSHMFIGTYEQNSLPFVMGYAAQIGEEWGQKDKICSKSTAIFIPQVTVLLVMIMALKQMI